MSQPIVIVGTGLAGYTLAREIRKRNPELPLTLVSHDDGVFYSKPMLSTALAQNKTAATLRNTEVEAMASELGAEILTHTRVLKIDREGHALECEGPRRLPYSKLVLAVGAQPIRLPIIGDGAAEVLSVNTLGDYARFEAKLAGVKHVALLGAGLIGCEFANDLIKSGRAVTVFDLAPQPLARLLPPQAASHLRAQLAAAGVDFRLQDSVVAVEKAGAGFRLTLQSGGELAADLVLSAVGLRPDTALAAAAALDVARGIVVDDTLATSDADIFALGDCAEYAGAQVLPYVMPIMNAARALAATLTGTPQRLVFPPMPVMVKTSLCPVVVCPPAGAGQWEEAAAGAGISALHRDASGRLTGFALVGEAVAERAARLKEMQAS